MDRLIEKFDFLVYGLFAKRWNTRFKHHPQQYFNFLALCLSGLESRTIQQIVDAALKLQNEEKDSLT